MIHQMEQDKDWYCVIWYTEEGFKTNCEIFEDEKSCRVFYDSVKNSGEKPKAYYNTELSWALSW